MARHGYPELAVVISSHGRYLGVVLGYGCRSETWRAPLTKYQSRVQQVRALGLGLQKTLSHYNMLALSVLTYVS